MKVADNIYDTIIIGGGPAGLFAASNLTGGKVLLIEKGERPGRKLLISGTGQCNFTHTGSIGDFLKHYGNNQRFLKHAIHLFSNLDLITFYKDAGVDSLEDKNGKIFPASLRAKDILSVLLNSCRDNNIRILTGSPVTAVEHSDGSFEVSASSENFRSTHLIIATGGLSYPTTGSTGDGYGFAEKLGHNIVKPKPALSPVIIRNYKMAELSGISISSALISLYQQGKKSAVHRGDIVFTFRGLSGPGILDFSRNFNEGDILKINFIDENPDIFVRDFMEASQLKGKSSLQSYLMTYKVPKNLLRFLISISGARPEQLIAEVPRQIRTKLTELLCDCPFEIEKLSGYKTAMATAGGVSLDEVSSKTMESKLMQNLFFAGEVLDIDGDTGGYNIQAAFSTAFVAAKAINSGRQQNNHSD